MAKSRKGRSPEEQEMSKQITQAAEAFRAKVNALPDGPQKREALRQANDNEQRARAAYGLPGENPWCRDDRKEDKGHEPERRRAR